MFVVYAELLSGYVKCSNKLRSGLGTQHSAARHQTEIVNGAYPGAGAHIAYTRVMC